MLVLATFDDAEEGALVDEQGWAETRRRLHAFVAARVSPAASAEDVVQEVLVKMVQNLDGVTDGARVDAWAHRIARNAITDEYRRRGRNSAALARLRGSESEPVSASAADAVLAADLVEMSGCLRPLVEALDEPYREALVLTGWQGLTQGQAAARAGVSLPGMKSRVQRGRAQLREQLLACCEPEIGEYGLRGRPTGHGHCHAAAGGCGCGSGHPPA